MDRRRFTQTVGGVLFTSLAGCANDPSGDSLQEQQTTCRTVEREYSSTVYNDLDTWRAGRSATWNIDLDRGEEIHVSALRVNDARPALEIKSPGGEPLIDTGPTGNIERRFVAESPGTYYVILENEAIFTSGQWDVTIEVTTVREERVCS